MPLHHVEPGHVFGFVHAKERVSVGHHPGPELRVDLWKRQGRALADGCQFGLRTFERRARREPPEHHKVRPGQRLGRRGARAQRHPEAMIDREREALRHHADYGMRSGPQLDGPSQNGGITREPIPPDVLADHDHGRRALALVVLHEIPAHQRPDPSHSESRGAHRRNADALRLCAGSDQVWRNRSECADLLNGFQLFAPDVVIVQDAPFGLACRRVPNLNRDNAVAFLEGQRRSQEGAINDAEPAGGDRDGHRNAEPPDQRKTGVLDQHPDAELDIQPPGIERPERSRVALALLRLFDFAEGASRGAACLPMFPVAHPWMLYPDTGSRGKRRER